MIEHSANVIELIYGNDGTTLVDASGVYGDIFKLIQKVTNLTYSMYYPADRTWGTKQAHGEWTGISYALKGN